MKNNICIIQDQYIWASVILKNPEYFELCKYYELYNNLYTNFDKWFFFLSYLS